MEQRVEFALKALKSENYRALCQQYGISAKTGYKWRERFLRNGLAGLSEETRRPQSSPQQLSQEEVCEMVRLKLAHPHWGPRKIRELYLRQHGEVASESSFNQSGSIRWKDQSLFLSQSLTGWDVGLKPTENDRIEVWFAQLLLGHIDPTSASFQRLDTHPLKTRQTNQNV